MNTLRRLFSSWKGALSGVIAIAIYLALPPILRLYDPTAGYFDAGYLQWIGLATAVAFWAGFVAWIMFQVFFSSLDRASSSDHDEWGALKAWFRDLSDRERWYVTQGAYVLCLVVFMVCLKLVPLG
jgi:hypothetical protein